MRGYRIGSIAGIDIEINSSWIIVFLLILAWFAGDYFPQGYPSAPPWQAWLAGLIASLLFFASVLVHEVAHSLTSRRYGTDVARITLFVFGGVAQIKGEPKTPLAELWIAIIGPLASLAIGLVLCLGYLVIGADAATFSSAGALLEGVTTAQPATITGGVVMLIGRLNFILAVFNLIPAMPLDGGRVLRACLWYLWDDVVRATRWATALGRGFGYLLMGLGVYTLFTAGLIAGIWYLGLGWLVLMAAKSAMSHVMLQAQLRKFSVGQLMISRFITIRASMPVRQAVEGIMRPYQLSSAPVVDEGRPVGVLTAENMQQLNRWQWDNAVVSDIMEPIDPDMDTIEADTDAGEAVTRLLHSERNFLLVTYEGRLVGLITEDNLTAVVR
ncbi:MAG: site-2 protease family protein [Armatimonadota bacterium]